MKTSTWSVAGIWHYEWDAASRFATFLKKRLRKKQSSADKAFLFFCEHRDNSLMQRFPVVPKSWASANTIRPCSLRAFGPEIYLAVPALDLPRLNTIPSALHVGPKGVAFFPAVAKIQPSSFSKAVTAFPALASSPGGLKNDVDIIKVRPH